MSDSKSDPRYTMGRSEGETERLIQQSQLYEAVTLRFFQEAGLVGGMRVLDVGSGAGDVAMAAAELVGAEGEVVGVDVNAAILDTARARVSELGFENIQFIAGDARTLDVGGDFDAVVGRLVLMYMSDPAEALKQLTRHLRPGGIVAFQEVDFTPYVSISRSDTPLMNKLVEWGIAVFQHSGAHTEMGMDLHRTFLDAGLSAPVLHFVAPLGGAESWAGYDFIANAFRSLVPLMEEFGIATAEEVDVDTLSDRIREETRVSKRPLLLPPHVTAWARLET